MSRVLLINPGFELNEHKKRDNYVFPFGLGYIASYAEKKGHEIDVWDIFGNQLDFNDVLIKIKEFDFSPYSIIGITGIVNQYLYVKELTAILKKYTSIPIILGGPLASYSWNIVLKYTNVDVCVIGEGEQTFLDLLNGKGLSSIDGIVYKINNEIKINRERELIKNIDDIGFPAFHLFDMDFYVTHSGMMQLLRPYYKNKKKMALITSRGCPYNCKFCSKSMKGIRMKSLDFLFKEIEYYKNELKVDAIHFVDELLLLNKKRFFEFCRRIKKHNIKWDCQGRINYVDDTILKAMKASNGVCIGFGIESGSQKILDAMDKRIKVKDIEKALFLCQKVNLLMKIQLIYGYPGENWQTLNETIDLFKKIRIPARRFTVITPLPGSMLYEEVKNDGFIGEKDSDVIAEEDYLILLSKNGGFVTKKIFYNGTEFPDDKFYENLAKVENKIFNNFLKVLLLHPFYSIRNWSTYKMYLKNWWKYYRQRILIFHLPEYLVKFISNPIKSIKNLKLFIKGI